MNKKKENHDVYDFDYGDKTEEVAKEVKTEKMKFRYQCEGCTNDAIRTINKMVGVKIVCPLCGKEQVTKESNFIAIV